MNNQVAIEMTNMGASASAIQDRQAENLEPVKSLSLYGRIFRHRAQLPLLATGISLAVASGVVITISVGESILKINAIAQGALLVVGLAAAAATAGHVCVSNWCLGRQTTKKKMEDLVNQDLHDELIKLKAAQEKLSDHLATLSANNEQLSSQLKREQDLNAEQETQLKKFEDLNQSIKETLSQYNVIKQKIGENLEGLDSGVQALGVEVDEAGEQGTKLAGEVSLFDKENDETRNVLHQIELIRIEQTEILSKVKLYLQDQQEVVWKLQQLFAQKDAFESIFNNFGKTVEHLEETMRQMSLVVNQTEAFMKRFDIKKLVEKVEQLKLERMSAPKQTVMTERDLPV